FIGDTNIVEARVESLTRGLLSAEAEGGLSLKVKTGVKEAGPDILLSLRPEKIQLFREKPPGDNVFPGTISLEIFKGATDELVVKTQSGLELSATSANDGNGQEFHEGDAVYFRIQPEDICLVRS
ncbi:MAG TPA: TOBE domain-containing protein, partial [Chthoniobacterales bacterium]